VGVGRFVRCGDKNSSQALELLPTDHWAISHVRGQLAGILDALGRHAEAREQYQRALQEELKSVHGNELDPSLRATRAFLGDLLIRMGDPAAALDIVRPGIHSTPEGDASLRLVEAEALLQLGKRVEAMEAAQRSLASSRSDALRERLTNRLSELGLVPDK
jgi:predicted negative regulator of RcsB-dependent stress response